jgi:hypothetical protein
VPANPVPVDPALISPTYIQTAPVNPTHVAALVNPIPVDFDPAAHGAFVYPAGITPLTPVHVDPVSVIPANSTYSVTATATLISCLLAAFFGHQIHLLGFHSRKDLVGLGLCFGHCFCRIRAH